MPWGDAPLRVALGRVFSLIFSFACRCMQMYVDCPRPPQGDDWGLEGESVGKLSPWGFRGRRDRDIPRNRRETGEKPAAIAPARGLGWPYRVDPLQGVKGDATVEEIR
jgi:hypothetical protein